MDKKLVLKLILGIACFSLMSCSEEHNSTNGDNLHDSKAWFSEKELSDKHLSNLPQPAGCTGEINSSTSWFNEGYSFSQACESEDILNNNATTYLNYFQTNFAGKFGVAAPFALGEDVTCYNIISKTDITGEKEIPGATLNLKGDNNTNLTWVSTSKSHKVTLKPGYYSLTETIAPKGYILSKETIEFRIDDEGNLYQKNIVSEYVKVDRIQMINEVRPTININKLDSKTNKYVSGATLNIKNNKGEVIASYVTDDKSHYISLEEGEYTLVEVAAPSDYKLNSVPIEFKVDADGNLYIKNSSNEYVIANGIILYNDPVEIIIPDVPKTGLSSAITYIIGSITVLGGAIILIRNGKKC